MCPPNHRPYKECGPVETTTAIRGVLAEIGLLPEEVSLDNPYPGLHSVRLSLPASLGSYGTNGKGRSAEYSLASAYAECMERMQNGVFHGLRRTMLASFRERYGFYFAPDEGYLTEDQLLALPGDVVADLMREHDPDRATFVHLYHARAKANGAPGVVAVPFYDTVGQNVVYLPLNLLLEATGPNGMAAGNTLPEAIFQASCELLERWAAAEVFFGRLTPPTVPRSYLQWFTQEYAIIELIESTGKYRVTVKDFSCDARIPALGLIVENRLASTYKLNVGCDTSFPVALSRCLTEVYQGVGDEEEFDQSALPIPGEEPAYFTNDDVASRCQRLTAFMKFTKHGRGPYPATLFGERASYSFAPDVWGSTASYEEEVRRLVAYFRRRGHNVYVRDASFLGFPSVQVYVPGVSVRAHRHTSAPSTVGSPLVLALDTIEAKALKLKQCSDQDLAAVAEVLERLPPAASFVGLFRLELKGSSPWQQVSVAFVLALIRLRLGQYNRARKSIQEFLDARAEKYRYGYYDRVSQYMARRAEGLTHAEAAEVLAQDPDWGEIGCQMAEEMADPGELFRFVKLPNCPDCGECELQPECITTGILSMIEKVYPAMLQRRIEQMALAWVGS
jgi:YcaO-like protein with predicted kinase domain